LSSSRSKKTSSKRQKAGNLKAGAAPPTGSGGVGEMASESGAPEATSFYALLFVGFFIAAVVAYQPALDGAFISDDEHYVLNNPFVHELSYENVVAILDPTGTPAKLVENYAPVHLLLNALQWQVFERQTFGYHVVNLLLHTLVSVLLMVVFRACGIGKSAALLGSAFFLLHPANVEAVAWISQLKTPVAMVLSLLALMAQRKRPVLALGLFALALFAKPTAAVALFVFATAVWQSRRQSKGEGPLGEGSGHGRWLVLWAVVFFVFAFAEFWAFNQTAGQAPVLYTDTAVRLRTVCAVSLRYVVMGFSSFGLSVFHEPPAADTWLDGWWLTSVAMLAVLAARTWFALVRGRSEALFWVWTVVSFAPICGIIPLPFPMADRYLYFIMPGLIGAVLIVGRDYIDPVFEKMAPRVAVESVYKAAAILAVVWIVAFGLRANERAMVWKNGYSMMADAEAHYPQGMAAQTRIARRRALEGDAEGAVAALQAAHARGYNRLDHLLSETGYDAIRSHPAFVALVNDLAHEWIERYEKIEVPDQHEYRVMAQAYIVLDDIDTAIRKIELGVEAPGPITEELKEDLAALRRKKRIRESVLPGSNSQSQIKPKTKSD
jgi:hypothetical protein